MARRRARLAALIAAGLLAACVQADGRRWSPSRIYEVSEDEEREIGAQVDAWVVANLALIDDPVVMGFINDFGQSLVRTIEPQPFLYRFRVIHDPRLNAFAVPGGYVYFHSETLLAASSLDELAGVLGHEIAHVKARHYKRGVEKNAIPSLLVQLAAIGATMATGHPAPMIVGAGVNVAFQLKYSREFEEEADRFGAVFMTRGGYDPRGMARFFERVAAEEEEHGEGAVNVAPYLYTHPDVKDRIVEVAVAAEKLRPVTAPDPALERAFRETQWRLARLQETGRTLIREARPGQREAVDPVLRLAEERVARGDRDGALALLAGGERNAPGDPRLPFRRGELLEEAGRLNETIAAYRRAVELDPTTGLVLYKLGRAYADAGDRHRAAYYLEQSVLHLGETSAVRKRAEREIERVTFPVAVDAGLADDFGDGPLGAGATEFRRGAPVVWWARIGARHQDQREKIRVRWRDPGGRVVQEEPALEVERPWTAARLALPDAAAGSWTVEATLEGSLVDRRTFDVR